MFEANIKKFNGMYKLPVATEPSLHQLGVTPLERLKVFKSILLEEVNEIDEIVSDLEANQELGPTVSEVEVLTKLADLLGDIQVYCASEMVKFGIPLNLTLSIIMDSNFSKMGADGKPIYDERGKLQKGPDYWKPEPRIQAMLATQILGSGHIAAKNLLDRHNREVLGKTYGAFDPLPGASK